MMDNTTLATRGHTAVMSSRVEPADSLDFFPTPPWATRALCERIRGANGFSVWEPACGQGHMSLPLAEYFMSVMATDVFDYGFGGQVDFLAPQQDGRRADWIVTNPPFRLAGEFIAAGIERSYTGVAMLVRTAFLEGAKRHREIFAPLPPSAIYQFVERVPMHRGRLVKDGSTATAYCWIVWDKREAGETKFRWIEPCRRRLERDDDYLLPSDTIAAMTGKRGVA